MYKRGEIVLIPVPFSNLQSNKKRPVFDSEDMESGFLPKVSCVRADKIYTLSKKIVVKKYGSLNKSIIEAVKVRVEKLISE